MTDQFLGNYRVIEKIGAGGMARVYLGVHKDIANLRVVLKILSDQRLIDRFKQEADKLALLDGHPCICRIKDFFTQGEETVIAMEYIEGQTLDDRLKVEGRLPVSEAIKIAEDVLDVLDFAHQRGIYHRDIKPSNIMIDKNGQVKIIDFGIAKGDSDPNLTSAGAMCGTPAYMAPEQFTQTARTNMAAVDIYALGTTLYRMVTGDMPFKGENEFLLRDAKLFSDPPPPRSLNPGLPKDVESVILKAMARDAEDRYRSAADMSAALAAVRSTDTTPQDKTRTDQKATPDRPSSSPKKGSGARYGIFGGVVLVLAAVGYFMLRPAGPEIVLVPVVLSSPSDGQVFAAGETPAFTWQAANPTVASYTVVYAVDSTFGSAVTDSMVTGSRYTLLAPPSEGTYYWRVAANGPDRRRGPWSERRSFAIQSAPAVQGGEIIVSIQPSGDLYLDEQLVARNERSRTLDVESGTHVLRVENAGAVRKQFMDTVAVEPGSMLEKTYRFTMPGAPPKDQFGEARIGSKPRGATVYIDDERQRQETNYTFRLKAGRHIIRAVLLREGQELVRVDTVQIVADGSLRVFFDFE